MIHARSVLADRVNRESLLNNEELFDYFARVQTHISDCLRVLTKATPSIALTILEVGSEVITKAQRNKSLFRRRVEFVTVDEDHILKDASMDPSTEIDLFLCECFDMARGMVRNEDISDHVENTRLSRMFLERFLRAWLKGAEDYEPTLWQMLQSFHPQYVNSSAYAVSAAAVLKSRRSLGIQDDIAYGTVCFVRERVAAIDRIYSIITQAYSRVILKEAKRNSVNEDHFLELFQYGYFGLQRANSSYDYVLNAKYVAVAKWWCRQSIMYWMKASSGIIKISPSIWQHRARMDKAYFRLSATNSDVTNEDIAREMKVSVSCVENTYASVQIAQTDPFEPVEHDFQTTDAVPETVLHEVTDAVSRLSPQEQAYMALLYGMPEDIAQDIPRTHIRRQKIKQKVAMHLIALT